MVMVGGGGGRQLREEGFLADAPGSYWFDGKEMNLQDKKYDCECLRSRFAARSYPRQFHSVKTVPTDVFAFHIKTKISKWRISGRYFRDYHC
jgi:hypothetical protein